jgi:hypothetical protein
MSTRLIVLLLGLLCVAWLAGAHAPAAGPVVGAPGASEQVAAAAPAELGAERVAGTTADSVNETVAPPASGPPAPAPSDRAARALPQRDALPRAPWLEGLLRPPCPA